MDGFGAKEKAEAEAWNQKPEKIRVRQPRQKRSPNESEKLAEAEASDLIRGLQPMQKGQKQCTDETKHAEGSSNKPQKRGRKRQLAKDERHERKIERDRQYRLNKNAKYQESEKENEELKRTVKVQESEIISLKKELSESKALADKAEREVSDESKKVDVMKMVSRTVDSEVQQLQDAFLRQDDQEAHAESLDFTKLIDDDKAKQDLLIHYQLPNPSWSTTEGIMGSSETVKVNGYKVKMENSSAMQEIFCLYREIDSGFRVHLQEFEDAVINKLAEVYEMAKTKKRSLEEMREDIKHLELSGIDFFGLMHRRELQGTGPRQERVKIEN